MGMDIYALDPKDPGNDYWRSSIGGWAELGGYIYEIAGATIDTVGAGREAWFSNNLETFDEECCERIAAEVRHHIAENGLPETPNLPRNPTQDIHETIMNALGASNVINMRPPNALAQEVEAFCAFLENSRGIQIT